MGNYDSVKKKFDKDPNQPKLLSEHIKPYALAQINTYKKKEWHWCGPETGGQSDGKWHRHRSLDCLGKAHKFKATEDATDKPKKEGLKLKLNQAYQSLLK